MKKIFVIVFILMMFINTIAYGFSDVSDNNLLRKIENLQDYDIINGYPDGTFKPDDNITRAAFSKMVVCMIGIKLMSDYDPGFTDTANHWANGYICEAKNLGIVNGVSSSLFAPENYVTYEQAAKMLVCSLGYMDNAIKIGGYPNGYVEAAKDIGIFSNTEFYEKDFASRANIAIMIYNTMRIDLKIENSDGKYIESDITYKDLLDIL